MIVLTVCCLLAGGVWAQENSQGREAIAGADSTAAPLTVGEITLHTRDIFSPAEVQNTTPMLKLLRRVMNSVHMNTREYVLRREILFATGDRFRPGSLAETERNLRNLGFLNNVSVVPTDTTDDGRVNVDVVTRESWTLQTTFSYSLASSGDQRWNVRLSDRNFLGHGMTLGAGIGADENSAFWNLWLRKRRLFGIGVLGLDYSKREDGHMRNIFFGKPFYAQGDRWGGDVKAWDKAFDARFYLSNAGPAGEDPTREERLYAKLPYREKRFEIRAQMRAAGQYEGRVWRVGAGVRVEERDYAVDSQSAWLLSDDRVVSLDWMLEPGQPLARVQGTTVFPHLWLSSQGRNWTKSRFVLQYGPVEDIPLDTVFEFRAGPNGTQVGSSTLGGGYSVRVEVQATKWLTLGPGLMVLQGVAEGETGSSEARNHLYYVLAGWMGKAGKENSPWLTRLFAEVGHGSHLLGSRALLLGLDRGLRTLEYDGMAGDRLARWNIEQGKATPWELLGLFRMGFAAFYNGGCAWWNDEQRDLGDARHEIGFGLRFGPTRSANSQVTRLDVTWDMEGSGGPVFTAVTRGFF